MSTLHGESCMERERSGYTTHQLYHHSLTKYLHLPYIMPDSHTVGCPLVNLHQADGLRMSRKNDIKEVSSIE